ncbi:BUB1_2 [Sanghuangporus vaninii]
MDTQPSSSKEQQELLEKQREQFRVQIAADDDDALAPYERYVSWLTEQVESSPHGPFDLELLTILEEAVRSRKDDPDYKNDVRYGKLWLSYARHVEKPDIVYVYLLKNNIGTKNAQLYEDYAVSLEGQDRFREAEQAYRLGIQRSKRGADRLKTRYREFKERVESKNTFKPSHRPPHIPPGESSSLGAKLYRNPLRNISNKRTNGATTGASGDAEAAEAPESPGKKDTSAKRSSDPYSHMIATMNAPPTPGKKPERYQIDMSLLFKDGQEFCIQEARAASLGLLGKKWGPPPLSENGPHQVLGSKQTTINLKDDGNRPPTRTNNMRMNMNMTAQLADGPTVTINTKEAMKDVFGMYNSPDRTTKAAPGTKFAPVKKLEPVLESQSRNGLKKITEQGDERDEHVPPRSTPFRPFVDVDDEPKKENAVPARAKFKPFVDENAENKTPHVTPKPRKALAAKEISSTTPVFRPKEPQEDQPEKRPQERNAEQPPQPKSVFSKVFTPMGQGGSRSALQSKPLQDRPSVFQNPSKPPTTQRSSVFSNVFSRPQEPRPLSEIHSSTTPRTSQDQNRNAPVFHRSTSAPQRMPFTPVSRGRQPVFAPQRAPLKPIEPEPQPEAEPEPVLESESESGSEPEPAAQVPVQEIEEYGDDFESDSTSEENMQEGEYYEDEDAQNLPMGGRLGRFEVLTPIAERTFECTMTQRTLLETPSDAKEALLAKGTFDHNRDAALAAEKLAQELREEEARNRVADVEMDGVGIEDEESVPSEEAEDEDLIERTGTLSLADAIAVASSFKPPNPCNPSDPHILSTLLSLIPPEPDFHDIRTEVFGRFESLQKFATRHARRGSGRSSSSSRTSDEADLFRIQLPNQNFIITDKLGEGGFGEVFKAKAVQAGGEADEDDMDLDDDDEEDANLFALKVVKPRNIWEFHILRRLHSVLPTIRRQSVVYPHALYAFRDESYLVLDLCNQGTLLDVVNHAADSGVLHQGACLDELLVMFFSIELLKFVESMHSIGFIHGDLKIDNCLLRLEEVPGGVNAWSGMYQPTGEGGWKYKGIKMIDFGRTIDTRMYPAGQQFIADWKTDVYDCLEMREDRPWTYETDYFGLAGIIYCMLFGKYFDQSTIIPISSTEPVRYKPAAQFKRYWQSDLWSRLFDLLLNPTLVRPDRSLPLVPELVLFREEMETWLSSNCSRSTNTLKGLLKKIERSVLSGSR